MITLSFNSFSIIGSRKIKTRALQEGVPYQTLLNSITHKYLNGYLVPKT